MTRVISYIDGFNLYHAIDDIGKPDPRRPAVAPGPAKPHLKWLDLWALTESIARAGETVVAVNYFSAYATWMPAGHQRHIEYVKALEHAGVTCHLGHFKSKTRQCRRCATSWTMHEEKETDVHIAARLVADAYEDRYDRAILISADSDLLPPLNIVKAAFPKKQIFTVAPPGRMYAARGLNPLLQLSHGRLEKCLLPDTASDASGRVLFTRPATYAPPK